MSCNVHTQARDVGWILRNTKAIASEGDADASDESEERLNSLYKIESLRGCDFFPQTGHVEGVAVLQRKIE